MDSRRISIIGASGAGTSTLGAALAQRLGCRHIEADEFFHEPTDPPYQRQRSPADRFRLITASLSQSTSWVLSGGVMGWGPHPAFDFSLVVFMRVPDALRLERLRSREVQRFGDRLLPGGDMVETHVEFMEWAAGYERGNVEGKTLARHEAFLAQTAGPVLRLEGDLTTAEQIERVLRHPALAGTR